MVSVKQERRWRRSVNVNVGPVAATFGGIAFGAAFGCVLALQCFDRVSRDLSIMMIFMGGAWGYTFWVMSDRARQDRFIKIVWLIALGAIAAILSAFPNLWSLMHRADGGIVAFVSLGGIVAASMLVVGTGWGLMHFIRYLLTLLRSNTKASVASSFEGVWDRELDQDPP
jgi:hypothetical protein